MKGDIGPIQSRVRRLHEQAKDWAAWFASGKVGTQPDDVSHDVVDVDRQIEALAKRVWRIDVIPLESWRPFWAEHTSRHIDPGEEAAYWKEAVTATRDTLAFLEDLSRAEGGLPARLHVLGEKAEDVASVLRSASTPAQKVEEGLTASREQGLTTGQPTLVDTWVARAKNHRWLSMAIFAAVIVIGVGSFTDSLQKIGKAIGLLRSDSFLESISVVGQNRIGLVTTFPPFHVEREDLPEQAWDNGNYIEIDYNLVIVSALDDPVTLTSLTMNLLQKTAKDLEYSPVESLSFDSGFFEETALEIRDSSDPNVVDHMLDQRGDVERISLPRGLAPNSSLELRIYRKESLNLDQIDALFSKTTWLLLLDLGVASKGETGVIRLGIYPILESPPMVGGGIAITERGPLSQTYFPARVVVGPTIEFEP